MQRLEQLAGAMIATGDRDDEEEARLYGQRLKAGVRALTSVSLGFGFRVWLAPDCLLRSPEAREL